MSDRVDYDIVLSDMNSPFHNEFELDLPEGEYMTFLPVENSDGVVTFLPDIRYIRHTGKYTIGRDVSRMLFDNPQQSLTFEVTQQALGEPMTFTPEAISRWFTLHSYESGGRPADSEPSMYGDYISTADDSNIKTIPVRPISSARHQLTLISFWATHRSSPGGMIYIGYVRMGTTIGIPVVMSMSTRVWYRIDLVCAYSHTETSVRLYRNGIYAQTFTSSGSALTFGLFSIEVSQRIHISDVTNGVLGVTNIVGSPFSSRWITPQTHTRKLVRISRFLYPHITYTSPIRLAMQQLTNTKSIIISPSHYKIEHTILKEPYSYRLLVSRNTKHVAQTEPKTEWIGVAYKYPSFLVSGIVPGTDVTLHLWIESPNLTPAQILLTNLQLIGGFETGTGNISIIIPEIEAPDVHNDDVSGTLLPPLSVQSREKTIASLRDVQSGVVAVVVVVCVAALLAAAIIRHRRS